MKKRFTNGRFYLEEGRFAEAVLCEGEWIRAVGTARELSQLEADEEIDLGGKTVLPGLNDAHCHIRAVGEALVEVNITGCRSIDELIGRCRDYIRTYPQRVRRGMRSMGWNQDLFTQGEIRVPTREDLDKISTEIPIVLERICGHVCSANSKALELRGVNRETLPPAGGTIEKDESGEPSGILTENAISWIEEVIPPHTEEEIGEFMVSALAYAQSVGLTSVQTNDAGVLALVRGLYAQGKAKIRFRHQICLHNAQQMDEYLREISDQPVYCGNRLTAGPLKVFKDGSLGGSTALVRAGYIGDEANHGVCVIDRAQHLRLVQEASSRGIQVVTHAIGDLAIEETLDVYEEALAGGANTLRHGLIHCQITDRALLERIAGLQVPVFYQPIFLDYDMHVVRERVGEELSSTSYAFKTALELGIPISFSTDAPVEDLNPFPNIYSAVTRCDSGGNPPGGFCPREKLTLPEAIDAYTAGSAYCEFQEDRKGRIREGYLADFTVLDRDIFSVDPMDIRHIRAAMTIVGGEVVYEAKG